MKAIRMVLGTMIAMVCLLTYAMPVSVLAHSSSDEIENDNLLENNGDFETDTEYHATGALEVSEQERQEFYASFPQEETYNLRGENIALPSSVDLSTSPYFPSIGDQGSYRSCVSWATTYYQFTYEAHKLNDIATTNTNAYSPRWTFNFTNHGCDSGTSYTDAYYVLRYQGAVSMDEYPYNVSSNFYKWLNNEGAMLNALKTKITNVSEISLNTTTNQITNNTDADLNGFKQVLNNGKVLEVSVISRNGLGNWLFKKTTSNEWAACRAYKNATGDGGHALTIVGYDDNIQCDVNGNGTIEATEKGAFKLANSWGTNWQKGNNGYVWVMYDALNKVSANTTNNWENGLPGTRIAIFDRGGGSINAARSITVSNQTINLAAVVNFNSDDCHNIAFFTNRCTGAYTAGTQNIAREVATNFAGTNEVLQNYSGPFVLDFGSLDDNIINYLSGYRWYFRVKNQSSTNNITCVSYKLIDDKDTTVKTSTVSNQVVGAGVTNQFYTTLNLQLGDLDYNGSLTSADVDLLLSIIVKNTEPSHLQTVLGDMNQDGRINIIDVITLNQLLQSNHAITSEELNAMYNKYQEYFQKNGINTATEFYEICSIHE